MTRIDHKALWGSLCWLVVLVALVYVAYCAGTLISSSGLLF